MKRLFVLIAAAAPLLLSLVSFDAEARKTKTPKEVWKSKEQLWAEDENRTEMRAWGFRQGHSQINLEAFAAEQARAELAAQTCVLVSRSIDLYTEEGMLSQTDRKGRTEEIDQLKDKVTLEITAVAKELIKGSRVAKSTRYEADKKGYQVCYVGVEVTKDDIIFNIIQTKAVKDALDDLQSAIDGVEDADFDSKSPGFQESTRKAFEELKQGKLNASDL